MNNNKLQLLSLPDADIVYHSHFLPKTKADFYFEKLLKNIPWKQEKIKIFGKEHSQPRLTALFATNNRPYSYSGLTIKPKLFPSELAQIADKIKKLYPTEFTTCLANLYRTGEDSMGWHSDDEKELGENPVIASVSLGAERVFHLKHKINKKLKHKIILSHGSYFS